ncbi:MAG: hypothetical protein CL606_07310 [Anaerolineaceae bacterium]|nr:hypothetical protein [Anaerolineaceae bacterium]HCU79612.1 hypothetical protein [Chloroflexota bacterium]
MDTITDIKSQRRDKNRVNVFMDGQFAFSLSYNQAQLLTVGQELSSVEMANLLESDNVEKAYEKALGFISHRPRSVLEVSNRLKKYGIDSKVAEEVISRLKEKNVLNDTDFALLWVENRSTFRPRGKLLLRKELLSKGISDNDIEIALSEVEESADARQLAYSKLSKYNDLTLDSLRQRIWSLLSRNGFDYSIVNDVVTEIVQLKLEGED